MILYYGAGDAYGSHSRSPWEFIPGTAYRFAEGAAMFVGFSREDPNFGFFQFDGQTTMQVLQLKMCDCSPIPPLEMLGRQAE